MEKLIESLAVNTQNGNVYAYLKSDKYKRKVLYFNGKNHFVKNNGKNIVFRNQDDINHIENYLKS